MKICTKCKKEKELIEFYKAARMKDGYLSVCKICADIATKISRSKKPEHYSLLRKKSKDKAWKKFHSWKRKIGCKYCKENEPYCLDLHHIDPSTKEYTLSHLVGGSWEVLMEEASKCVIVCKNCHAKIHAGIIIV
ncbi:hypothetical protein LCGC14_1980740 [marine sediment metagenome]|uniref:HNH nuclease domain-containing protein n=1 Tax=marine sediment metagenome TaxID=412755 RepID=A0A0F9I5Z9_9ZZZZ